MSDLAVGSTIAGCELEAVAGRGGMGVVYRAVQATLGRPVAVKAMAAALAEDADFRERFQRESQIAASIDHPNVIPVYEAGELDGTLYLIMRWVDGTDLRSLLHDCGQLPAARAIRLLRPVASALSAAHRSGLVHRDIKPANVLIAHGEAEEDEHVYLTDFGIARRTDGEAAMTRTGVFVGTLDYTAPERIEGGKGDGAADIYSFGCMLYETLTGHVPFERPSEVAKMFAHINDPIPSARAEVDTVPQDLDLIIARAMAKGPADRFHTAAELVAALTGVLQEMETAELQERRGVRGAPAPPAEDPAPTAPTVRPDAPRVRREPHPDRRAPRRALLLASLGLLIVAGIVIALTAGGGGSPSAPSQSATGSGAGEVSSISGAGLSQGRSITLAGPPGRLTAGPSGNVWASLPGSGAIDRIDAVAGRRKVGVGGHPYAIAAGPGGIWVAGSAVGPLARFNERTGSLEAVAQLGSAPSAVALSAGDGSAWASESSGRLTHLDAAGTILGTPTTIRPAPVSLADGEGWLWAVNGASLVRVGAAGPAATAFPVGPDPVSVTLDQGVWTAHANGRLARFDPRPGYLRVNTDVAIAPELDAVSAIDGLPSVWAISRQAKTLYRISTAAGAPITGRVIFKGTPVALAVAPDAVWVATQDGQVIEILT